MRMKDRNLKETKLFWVSFILYKGGLVNSILKYLKKINIFFPIKSVPGWTRYYYYSLFIYY